MAAEKKAFEAHANHRVQITGADGREIRLDEGAVYETSDPDELRDLEDHPFTKPAEAKKGAK